MGIIVKESTDSKFNSLNGPFLPGIGRVGVFHGVTHVFQHRNPKNGKVYGETIRNPLDGTMGCWVPSEHVRWI